MPIESTPPPAYGYAGTTVAGSIQTVINTINATMGSVIMMFGIPIKVFELSFAWVTPLVATIDQILSPFASFGGV